MSIWTTFPFFLSGNHDFVAAFHPDRFLEEFFPASRKQFNYLYHNNSSELMEYSLKCAKFNKSRNKYDPFLFLFIIRCIDITANTKNPEGRRNICLGEILLRYGRLVAITQGGIVGRHNLDASRIETVLNILMQF